MVFSFWSLFSKAPKPVNFFSNGFVGSCAAWHGQDIQHVTFKRWTRAALLIAGGLRLLAGVLFVAGWFGPLCTLFGDDPKLLHAIVSIGPPQHKGVVTIQLKGEKAILLVGSIHRGSGLTWVSGMARQRAFAPSILVLNWNGLVIVFDDHEQSVNISKGTALLEYSCMHNLWNQMFEAWSKYFWESPLCPVQLVFHFLLAVPTFFDAQLELLLSGDKSMELGGELVLPNHKEYFSTHWLYIFLYKYKSIMRVIKAIEEKEGTAPIEYAIYIYNLYCLECSAVNCSPYQSSQT